MGLQECSQISWRIAITWAPHVPTTVAIGSLVLGVRMCLCSVVLITTMLTRPRPSTSQQTAHAKLIDQRVRKNKKWHAEDCSQATSVSVHPFKKPKEYFKCLGQIMQSQYEV